MSRLISILCFTYIVASTFAAEVGVVETWPDTSLRGWMRIDQSTGVLSDQNLDVSEGALRLSPTVDAGSPLNPRWSFVADISASEGWFTGSLYGVGAETLDLDFQSSVSVTLKIQLVHNAIFGAVYNATMAVDPGTHPSRISMPLDLNHFSPDFFGNDALFETIIRATDQVWITMEWDKNAPSPIFMVDNVELKGAGAGYGAWIDGFGLVIRQRLPGTDADEDGDSNAAEFIVDSLPDDPASRFSFGMNGSGLEWASSSNCNYTVMRSTNLTNQAFIPSDALSGSGAGMSYQDSESLPCAFYKISVERK
ncbi:hypothetical protein [Pontiella sulfatireligans]|uniref:Uncharacterized protein n=1 Tax=Pontiella sulfatireligans TaxID=2750658 RepID=A0A6C2USL3_9BACT|nr:hypothetical protein [Pontiella sulfatireligans]VGO22244.1 hypothetical protein SCARR_04326 [Pontiella sulfatireligans]